MASFAVCSSPVDKEGYLQKKGDLNRDVQRRWFVLKGNLLFYFQKKQDKEPLGVIVLEACSVQVSSHGRYSFEISFDGIGTRTYILYADNDEDMQSWIKAISHASYEYLRSIVTELQRRVSVLTSSSKPDGEGVSDMSLLHVAAPKGSVRLPQRSRSEKVSSMSSSDGGNPLAQRAKNSPKVKVKNGILVDVEMEEAPPVPPKMKSMTIHSPSRARHSPSLNQRQHSDDSFIHVDSSDPSTRPMLPVPSKPHSSPLILSAPLGNPSRPLSPPSTLDRTPVLQPLVVDPSPPHDEDVIDRALPPRPPKPKPYGGHNGQLKTEGASVHPVGRQVAAPLDPKKTIYEMHEEFTQAMEALKSEKMT